MQLSKYISDLLYRYECVIVPNFGGFVSNTIPSKRNTDNHQFTPPTKTISFNINLQKNDGLLVNHIAKSLNISFDKAATIVQTTIENWQKTLEENPLLLNNIGQFTLENEQLVFEPLNKINYLTSSFGLSDVNADYILRNNIVSPKTEVKRSYGKYFAGAAIIAGLFFAGSVYVQQQINQQEIADQQEVTNQIQQASFNILKPLPAVTLTVEKEVVEEVSYKYHIIAGAFKESENALKKVNLLKAKGYNASIMGLNKWGLTQVSYASFNNKRDAINTMNAIRKKDNKHAWLFINE
ncbi:HU domain-containing protein [Wenyingzhuangia sp. IMCC45467]